MWSMMDQGLATTVLNYTNDLSLLLIGLIIVEWSAAAIIVWMAIQHYWPQTQKPNWSQTQPSTVDTSPFVTDRRDAA